MKERFIKAKNYLVELAEDESGMELMQIAIVVALVASLIVVAAYVITMIAKKLGEAGDAVNGIESGSDKLTQETNPMKQGGE